MRLVVSSIFAVGVRVAVQVTPPSVEATPVRVPLATDRSLLSKPLTASEKVIVTSEVSPACSALSATTIVADDHTAELPSLWHPVCPRPVLPAASATPVVASAIGLVVPSLHDALPIVAVQVTPPSVEATPVRVPLATDRSLLSKPLTASEKVIVTSEVSPACSALSATTIVAVGRFV